MKTSLKTLAAALGGMALLSLGFAGVAQARESVSRDSWNTSGTGSGQAGACASAKSNGRSDVMRSNGVVSYGALQTVRVTGYGPCSCDYEKHRSRYRCYVDTFYETRRKS